MLLFSLASAQNTGKNRLHFRKVKEFYERGEVKREWDRHEQGRTS